MITLSSILKHWSVHSGSKSTDLGKSRPLCTEADTPGSCLHIKQRPTMYGDVRRSLIEVALAKKLSTGQCY